MDKEVIGLVIQGVGTVATIILTIFILKANELSADAASAAARAAQESAEVSSLLYEMQTEQRQNMRSQIINKIIRITEDVILKLQKAKPRSAMCDSCLKALPEKIIITDVELANYFSDEERNILNSSFYEYRAYRESFFNKDGVPMPQSSNFPQKTQDLIDSFKRVKSSFEK